MEFMCNFCAACFIVRDDDTDEARKLLRKHKEKCTEDDPYKDDESADYYDEWF